MSTLIDVGFYTAKLLGPKCFLKGIPAALRANSAVSWSGGTAEPRRTAATTECLQTAE